MGLRKRSAEHCKVLTENENKATIDGAVTGDDAVARHLLFGHAEIRAPMLNEHVELFKGINVQQKINSLPRRQFSLLVLSRYPLLTTAHPGRCTLFFQLADDVLHRLPRYSFVLAAIGRRMIILQAQGR